MGAGESWGSGGPTALMAPVVGRRAGAGVSSPLTPILPLRQYKKGAMGAEGDTRAALPSPESCIFILVVCWCRKTQPMAATMQGGARGSGGEAVIADEDGGPEGPSADC